MMRKLLKGLSGSIEIQMEYEQGQIKAVCAATSGILDVEYKEFDDDGKEIFSEVVDQVLMLLPCLCQEQGLDSTEELAFSTIENPN